MFENLLKKAFHVVPVKSAFQIAKLLTKTITYAGLHGFVASVALNSIL